MKMDAQENGGATVAVRKSSEAQALIDAGDHAGALILYEQALWALDDAAAKA